MPDFSTRANLSEWMDTEDCGFEEFRACLRDLERVNALTFTYRPTIGFFERLEKAGLLPKDRPLVVVDVGSGYGGMLRQVGQWAKKRGLAVTLTGVDLNPWSAAAASEATPPGQEIAWVTADLFAYRPPGGIDVIMSSQFTHHLDEDSLVRFLRWMEDTARIGWFVSDLHRHPIPYYFFRLWSRLAGWHRFVRHDGPISIRRAFRASDWQGMLTAAGINLSSVAIRWSMPFRFCLERIKRT